MGNKSIYFLPGHVLSIAYLIADPTRIVMLMALARCFAGHKLSGSPDQR
jgi:hypothetical protein